MSLFLSRAFRSPLLSGRPVLGSALAAFAREKKTYSMVEHQARALKQNGRGPSKIPWGKWQFPSRPRVDKKFVEPERAWILVDAYGMPLGRLAAKLTGLLCGKHKPIFQSCRDVGDNVVVVNAGYVVVSEKAMEWKRYFYHTEYPGGLRRKALWQLFEDNPTEPLRRAVFGMLPKNKMRHQRMTRLRLYPAGAHNQESNFRGFQNKAFRAVMSADDNRLPMQLQRIQPALSTPVPER